MRVIVVLLLTFLFLSPFSRVLAQEEATTAAIQQPPPSSTYTLPYPGMLPDNPFYVVKMVRDRIVLFLISDPLKKAQFNLLQADKRLQAGVYLWNLDKEKVELVIETISKGENYFELALDSTRQAKKEGQNVGPLVDNLEQASRKHTEVLVKLQTQMPSVWEDELQVLLKRTQSFTQSASEISD